MRPRTAGRLIPSAVLAMAGLTLGAPAASAATDITVPAGMGCSFELHVAGTGGHTRTLTFEDKDGDPVRSIEVGIGDSLTFTNKNTGKSLTLRSSGFSKKTVFNPDGTQTVTASGTSVLILFPTDQPAGPSTTLIKGTLVYNDDQGTFTVRKISGNTTNICAALA